MTTKKFKLDDLVVLGVMMIMLSLLVALNSPAQAQAASACTANITNYWKFDEITGPPFMDSVAGVNNAVCSAPACPASTVDGRINNALLFDGVNDGVNVPAAASFDWGNATGFSMEFWMKTDVSNTCAGTQVLMGRNDSPASSLLWYVGCSGGKAEFYLSDKSGISADIAGTSDVTGGQWHHIVAVRDAGANKVYVYVDGVIDASANIVYTSGFDSAAAQLNIGWLNMGPGYHFAGAMDEVALYNRALSSNEIKQHYHDGSVGLRRGYCGCASPVKIMPLGDSITAGDYGDTRPFDSLYGFRKPLYESLVSYGYDVDFVGSLQYGSATFPPVWDIDHEGHMGFRANGPDPNWSIAPNVYTYLATNPADVVLLHIGTNDITHGSTTVVSDVATILDNIDSYSQDVTVVLARIINRTDGFAAATTQFNIDLAAMAANRIANGDKIIIVDQENALNYATDMFGPLHPNDSGYNKMANVWLKGLSDILPVCGTGAPLITSNPITEGVVNQLYVYDVNATGNPTPTYSLVTFPPNMTIDPATGVISWTPAAPGPVDVVVQAGNSGGVATQSFTIQVSVCPSDMTHYWKLDETAQPYIDLYGNNDATCTNCPSATAGIVGGAQEFNLTSQVNVADDNTFDWSVATGFSMEFWMKTDVSNTCTGTQVLMGRNDTSASSLLWYIGCSGGKVEFYLSDKSGINADILGASNVTGGQWHHIVAVRDAGADKIYVYVDGVQDASTPAPIGYTSGFDSAAAQLNIGWLNMGPGYHFAGAMDEVALYNRALSDAEIQSHYNNGTSGNGYCGGGYIITGSVFGGNGTISCTSPVSHGGTSTCTITANAGYRLSALTDNGSDVMSAVTGNNPYAYTITNVTANHTVVASFATNTYTLTVSKSGNGIGTVTSSPSGINCGSDCSEPYNTGTVVTLTATPDANSTFTWTGGGCSGTGLCVLTMNADTTVTATFTLKQYTVTPSAGPNGSISPPTPQTVNHGSSIQFTITPNISYRVADVKVDGSSVGAVTSYTFNNITANHTIEATFIGMYSISGTVTVTMAGSSTPIAGVTMTLGGSGSGSTLTDASGNYSLTGLSNSSYTVAPSKTGYTFTPTSRTATISGANVIGQNFTGTYTRVQTYSILGTVTDGVSPLSGVTMTLSGAGTGTTTTGANGNYTFTGVANGTYTVTPSKTGYTFSPTSRTATISGANVTGQNFTGTSGGGTYSISGKVTTGGGFGGGGSSPLAGVTVALSGAASRTTTTDSLGRYSFTGLANGSYTVTPSMTGYTFTPTSRAVTISGANATGQDFTR